MAKWNIPADARCDQIDGRTYDALTSNPDLRLVRGNASLRYDRGTDRFIMERPGKSDEFLGEVTNPARLSLYWREFTL